MRREYRLRRACGFLVVVLIQALSPLHQSDDDENFDRSG